MSWGWSMSRIWAIVGLCCMSGSTQRRAINSIRLSCFDDGFSSNLESTVSNACWFPIIDFTHSIKSGCAFFIRKLPSISISKTYFVHYIFHFIISQYATKNYSVPQRKMCQSIYTIPVIDCSPKEVFQLSSPWEVYQSYKHHSSLWMD